MSLVRPPAEARSRLARGADAPATAGQRLDADNPWPGLDAFDEASRRFFHGRDEEIETLARRVEGAPLVVLFGKSGLGKTSLLRAGLMPRLRERRFVPVYVRLVFQEDAPAPVDQLRDALVATLAGEGIDAPPFAEGETLWAYLHRRELEFWTAQNFPCTPVFMLDQFEEVFTLGERRPQAVAGLRVDLGDLAENRIPARLDASAGLALREMRYRFLVSLREDFLPELEGWRASIPGLGKVRMRLAPLQPAQAFEAVHAAAPHLMDERLARRIVDFVAAAQGEPAADGVATPAPSARGAEVEPALLSLFCRGLNETRKREGKPRFDDALLDGAKQGILADYYHACFDGMPESVRRFVATELITEKGYRNSVSKDDATPEHLSEEQLSTLIDRRLLRVEERYGMQRIELTHDLLTRVVREARDRLRRDDQRAAALALAAEERRALEERLQGERRAERERQLERELRDAGRFKLLAAALAVMLVAAGVATALALAARREAEQAARLIAVQTRAAESARAEAERQAAIAASESKLAQERLKRITDSIGMKQAVLAGDRARVARYLASPDARSSLDFGASATSLGYKNPQGQTVYRFDLMPRHAPEDLRREVAVVTYRMDHPTFHNSLLATGPERGFTASYTGWGCLANVTVLIEYVDPDRPPEIAAYDMCRALGW